MTKNQVSAKARGLGVELKDLRAKSGLSTRDAARKIALSHATLNRVELGLRPATPEEVFGLLVAYDVPVTERERLLDMAREAAMPGWWEGSSYTGTSKHQMALADFESVAAAITNVSITVVPGLLQTTDYSRAALQSVGNSESIVERAVALRAGRQTVLGKPRPPRYLALLDEAVLRRHLGEPAMMAQQLRQLLEMTKRPHVTVQVMPFSQGGHLGIVSSFTVVEFGKSPTVVFLEHLHSSVFLDQHPHTRPFQAAINSIAETALGPAESADLISRIAADYERK